MKLKRTHSIEQAALRSGFSRDTGYRIHRDLWLASKKQCPALGGDRIH